MIDNLIEYLLQRSCEFDIPSGRAALFADLNSDGSGASDRLRLYSAARGEIKN
jgi:hypothetical protein